MILQCSACKRSFREPGFCPYDGTQLQVVPEAPLPPQAATIHNPTELDAAEARRGEIDERMTLPLTPSTPSTATGSAPPETREPVTGVRALSAAENTDAAIRAMRVRTEYDRLVGETLDGRYFVQRKIGEGGMGVVFAVRHAVIERPLAVKVLKREVMRDDATLRRFVQEARAASRIGHPNIVDVTDFGKTPEGLTYCVMEYIEGQTLSHAIRYGAPFPLVRVIRIAAQIARALGVAHDKGIVHRDLKPENVFLVDRDGRPDFVKIVDFGIAKVAPLPGEANPNQPRLTKVGSVFGTPEYMAPEQAAGRGDTDGRVDIYALGVIVYEMLVGRVPHKGDSMVRTLAMQMLDPIVPPSQVRPDVVVTPEAEAVVMRTLAKKRDLRYQTMGELLAALELLAKHALPAPVGASATGSPVYQLTPLPPGADPSTSPGIGGTGVAALMDVSRAAPLPRGAVGMSEQRAAVFPEGGTATRNRIKDEPQFVSAERPAQFVLDDPADERPRARWGIAALSVLAIAAVTAAAVMTIVKRRNAGERVASADDAGLGSAGSNAAHDVLRDAPRDATVVAEVAPDAGAPGDALADVPVDATADVPADAAVIVHNHVPDRWPPAPGPGPHHTRDPGDPTPTLGVETPNHRGTIIITVMTKPDTAALYVGTTYHGPGGTSIEEPYGTRYEVQCRAPGYKPGKVALTFDGKTEVTLCVMQRIKICIDNLKNPFDDCEVDPSRPSPDHTVQPTTP